jgi:hypothetical protein
MMYVVSKHIGGQNLEGRFFIVSVPDDWTENDSLPPPSPEDRWFDRMTDFKAALDCPWIRLPRRHMQWTERGPGAPPASPRPRVAPAALKPQAE